MLRGDDKTLAASCVQESSSGDIILKLVSRADAVVRAQVDLSGLTDLVPSATCTIISGDPLDENNYSFWHTHISLPEVESIQVAPHFVYDLRRTH